jgi:two-component sensor histidine kinase
VLAHRGLDLTRTSVGSRVSLEGENVSATVRRTGRPARVENDKGAPGPIADLARTTGLRSTVGAPIVVDGRLWGIITASWKGEQSPPAVTEKRMAQFAALLDIAIATADSRDQLTASRARLVTAWDEARRQLVRDLHDGAQQRQVHTIVMLKFAQRALREGDGEGEWLVGRALEQAEASAYFIVAELLTNVVKHSHTSRAEVRASVADLMLHINVRDDGIGGADPGGYGLVGIGDRVSALGGRLEIQSPAGAATFLAATLQVSLA